jgi:hypothetical protein
VALTHISDITPGHYHPANPVRDEDGSQIRTEESIVAGLSENRLTRKRAEVKFPTRLAGFVGGSRPTVVLQMNDETAGFPGLGQEALRTTKQSLSARHRPISRDERGLEVDQQQGLRGSHAH